MEFLRITNDGCTHWKDAWDLYELSFPIFEKRNLQNHIEAMGNENFHCDVILENEKFIGILFYWVWNEFKYVEHFAINPELRGKNYGSKVLEEFCKDDKITILEIDPPVDEISIRRRKFYERMGFVMNEYKHIQLPYRKGHEGYVLKILTYGKKVSIDEYNEFYKYLLEDGSKYIER